MLNIRSGSTKHLSLDSGEAIETPIIIIATGATWRSLNIPGEKEFIGRGVGYCPHCDGPFYKGQDVAVVGGGNSGVEAAIDLAQICRKVTLFEYDDQLKADQHLVDRLGKLSNVTIQTSSAIQEISDNGSKVSGIVFTDRNEGKQHQQDLSGVFIQAGLSPNSQFLGGIVALNGKGEIVVDEKGRTSVEGIYAAGDVTTIPFKQIITSMGDGAKVALTAFEDKLAQAN